jgi:hypothetical protein
MQKIAPPFSHAPTGGPEWRESQRKSKRRTQLIAIIEFVCGSVVSVIFGTEGSLFTQKALGVLPTQPHAIEALATGVSLSMVGIGALAVAAHGALTLWRGKEP